MHASLTAVERIWHTPDSQGQILALAFRRKSSKPSKLFPLRSEAVPGGNRATLGREARAPRAPSTRPSCPLSRRPATAKEDASVEQFSHLLATHQHKNVNNGSNSSHLSHDPVDLKFLLQIQCQERPQLEPFFMSSYWWVAYSCKIRSTSTVRFCGWGTRRVADA